MTLSLTLENAPHPQAVSEMRHEFGELSIGRSSDVDWQIDDPEMYVSRKHCIIRADNGRYTVTDASRGGLFIDGSETPLGAGNSAQLENGMRLRLGDYVIRVAVEQEARTAAPSPSEIPPQQRAMQSDDFFTAPVEREVQAPRPKDMPPPFEQPEPSRFFDTEEPARRDDPGQVFDDPFTLDPLPSEPAAAGTPTQEAAPDDDMDFGDFFGETEPEPVAPKAPPRTPPPEPAPVATPAAETAAPAAAPSGTSDEAVLAFLRGMGLDKDDLPQDAVPAELMEAMGRRFALMLSGLQHLLRARAREKQDARIAQTIIGQSNVNPLKFMVTPEDAARALIGPSGAGYLEAEDAINGAFRDIAQHNIDSWRGVQEALRRMIDRFEPSALERELEEVGMIETLIAGGRNAKLWQLYRERYAKIAKSAEERFLGDVGEDFRDAYERK